MIEKVYEDISILLANIESGVQVPENFESIFNELGLKLEVDRHEDLPASEVSTLAWNIRKFKDQLLILAPPFIYKQNGVRLGIPIKQYLVGTHLKVFAFPFPTKEGNENSYFQPCITTQEHANLLSVFALWDFVAREGIENSIKLNLITEGWISNIFNNIPKCQENYPLIKTYKGILTGKKNQEIITLERIAKAHGITSAMAHGEGSRDSSGRYYNTWFSNGICTCCNRSYRSPSRAYPNSYLSHVTTIKHRRNAIEFLLKQRKNTN